MAERSLQPLCKDCGRPLAGHDSHAVRCAGCFDDFLQVRDAEFLSNYAELGVTSRRIIAETAFRALAMDNPPHRKVLAMHIMDQYVEAAGDLIGLYHALRERRHAPVMRSMLEFKLDRTSAVAFFREVATTPGPELLAKLGLPNAAAVAQQCPSLSKSDAKDLSKALDQLVYDLAYTADLGEAAALAIAQMAESAATGRALVQQSAWLDNVGLRAEQIAAVGIDASRRTVSVNAVSVDEKKLESVISHINAMTRAAQNMIYGVLTMYQEDKRAKSTDVPRSRRRKPA